VTATFAPRRFWKTATVTEVDGGYGVALDGRPVKAPSRRDLTLATRALAEAVAAEWDAQDKTVDPTAMPMTQLANTLQDRIAPQRDAILDELVKYVDGDALCYRATHPGSLVERQARTWQPLLDWAERRTGLRYVVTEGVMPMPQDAALRGRLRELFADLDDARLTALQVAAPLCGSLVIAFALVEGEIDVEGAYQAAFLDELYQIELWGEDKEVADRRSRLRGELEQAMRFVNLAHGTA